jgi:D-aminopeptidase
VTVVRPHGGDPYRDRVPAAGVVLNGFGKSVGLMQVEELGVLETPIALTNTFSVPAVAAAQIRAAIADNPEIGRALPTLNPLVFECNDGYLNDIQRMAVEASDYRDALGAAGADVAEGSVGAGRGIGTASRRVRTRTRGRFTLGTLVLSNFGKPSQIRVCGTPLAAHLRAAADEPEPAAEAPEKGSIIMIVATDAPLDARQLRRLALRAGAGLARTGSVFGHGSGDIALAFSTAYTVPHDPMRPMPALALLHDTELDPLFEAAADGIEQAIIHAVWRAEAVTGRDGHRRRALSDLLPGWADILGA